MKYEMFILLFVLIFLSQTADMLRQDQYPQRKSFLLATNDKKSNEIDPLQFLKPKISSKLIKNFDEKASINEITESVDRATLTPTFEMISFDDDTKFSESKAKSVGISVQEFYSKVGNCEISLLPKLPNEIYSMYISYCRQFVPRVSITAAVLYVMLLIPSLKYIKLFTQISPLPFLYLGPVVFVIPYLVLYLWESNILDLPFMNAKLVQLITALQQKATKYLETESNDIIPGDISEELKFSPSDDLDSVISKRAFIQLITKIDVESLAKEVLALKAKGLPISSPSSNLDQPSSSVSDAVQSLLSQVSAEGGTSQEILEELKQLQRELDAASNGRER